MEKIYQQTYKICNRYGLHIRPSTAISKLSRQYVSEITICNKGKTANATSIIELLSLGTECGEELIVKARGEDCQEAVEALGQMIDARFGLTEESEEELHDCHRSVVLRLQKNAADFS